MDLDRSTVAAIVQRLEHQGLLRRDRDTQDRRRNQLFVTDLGRTTRKRLTPLVLAEEQVLAESLSDEEKEQLRTLLKKLLLHNAANRSAAHRHQGSNI
jgi:DNA-binding MarR family transcriptional regulator